MTESPAWAGSRVARPVSDLPVAIAFYRDVLGLASRGGFRDHDGYDGEFFALPGGGELELTAGSVAPGGGTVEDLLVLYVRTDDELGAAVERLRASGAPHVPAENPYWDRWGRTFLDPDGYRVVIARRDAPGALHIDWHVGDRAELDGLFAEAEDSVEQLRAYRDLGRVLVARRGSGAPVGHLQLVPTDVPQEIEIKNMAVVPAERGNGVGRSLVEDALRRCAAEGISRVLVATAAADPGNLRFYQRLGFRMHSIEPDAFTPATGYPEPILIDGIPLRDRVWLVQSLHPHSS